MVAVLCFTSFDRSGLTVLVSVLIHYKFWLLSQPEESVPLTYNGKNCGSCDNLNTAWYFLMKLNKWIDGKVEIMHGLSFC